MNKDLQNHVHVAKVSKIQRSSKADIHKNVNDFLCDKIMPHLSGGAGGGGGGVQTDIESPDHTQRDTNESDNNISSCSTLDIVNKVEQLSLHQLETQVKELSQRLQQTETARTHLQRQLKECTFDKELCLRRLEVVGAAHECRITEMHCVIAELSKKLRAKQECVIPEEQEPELEGSEISFQEGSAYNSELNLTNPEGECQADLLELIYSPDDSFGNIGDDNNLCVATDAKMCDSVNKAQVEALQEEILHLKAQIALLQSEIANTQRLKDISAVDKADIIEERQNMQFYDDEVEANASPVQAKLSKAHLMHKKNAELNDLDMKTQIGDFLTHHCSAAAVKSSQKNSSVPKMAERVKLHCASKTEVVANIIDADLSNAENADNSQQIVADNKQNNMNIAELQATVEQPDMAQLVRKFENLKLENKVLQLTLSESKAHCEHLYLLCGKYESNSIALQLALNFSDRAVEAYDVMLALLESNLALIKEKNISAEESRKSVESVARHFLDRLDSEKETFENSSGPWQNSFNIPDELCMPWMPEDDQRLRLQVSKLKAQRATVQNTIVNLESPFSDYYEVARLALERNMLDDGENQSPDKPIAANIDLEMAVLMQELMNLREENIKLKTKVDKVEKQRLIANDKSAGGGFLVSPPEEAANQIQLICGHEAPSVYTQPLVYENAEAERAAMLEQQLIGALAREAEAKMSLHAIVAAMENERRANDEKFDEMYRRLCDMHKSHAIYGQIMEQHKNKNQARIRYLQEQIISTADLLKTLTGGAFSIRFQFPKDFDEQQALSAQTNTLSPENMLPETTL